MNFAIEIEILKRRIEELSRNSGNFSPVTWGTIIGKLREQKDIAKNFRLKQDLLQSGVNIKTINGDRNRINNAPHSAYLIYVDDVAAKAAGLIKGNVYYNTTIGGLKSVV